MRRTDLMIDMKDNGIQVHTYRPYEQVRISLHRQFERIDIDSELAANLTPVEIKPGLLVSTVTGSLAAKDNKFELKPLTKTQLHTLQSVPGFNIPPTQYNYGTLDVTLLMQKLIKIGIFDAKLEQSANGAIIQMVIQYLI